MKTENTAQLLRNPEQEPNDNLFKEILREPLLDLLNDINSLFLKEEVHLEWRYYRDGKAWLGKATYKKKTLLWMSLWTDCIKVSFYFTAKTRPAVLNLNVEKSIKVEFANQEPIGRLIPLILNMDAERTFKDFEVLVKHKKTLH